MPRTELVLSPLELLGRLSRLIPPPRVHRQRYHGVFAPHARLRPAVVAIGRNGSDVETSVNSTAEAAPERDPLPAPPGPRHSETHPERSRSARVSWAQLLARIYEVLPLLCPACAGEMRILTFLTDPFEVRAILRHLGHPDRPPPLAPARGPPQREIDFDQTSGFDPTDGDPGPDFDFDPSLPEDLDA